MGEKTFGSGDEPATLNKHTQLDCGRLGSLGGEGGESENIVGFLHK